MDITKYIKSIPTELLRSEIHFSDYNPRKASPESLKTLKRGIRKYGLTGGIVVNKRTGNTIVSGHQRISVLDDLQKYKDGENDYKLRVDVVDVDPKAEKELNILFNNPNAQGEWDYDKLAKLIPDIDYKDAGLTDADLSMIGCDYLFQTEAEANLNNELDALMSESRAVHEREILRRKEERQTIANAQEAAQAEQAEYDAKKQHMKDVKAQVREQATRKAQDMESYVMLSFSTFQAKAAFMARFGYDAYDKFIKGEEFSDQIERVE